MGCVIQCDSETTRYTGFQIRLSDPASVIHQKQHTPICKQLTGASVLGNKNSNILDSRVKTSIDLIETVARFAHKHQFGKKELVLMMQASPIDVFNRFEDLCYAVCHEISTAGNSAREIEYQKMKRTIEDLDPELVPIFKQQYAGLCEKLSFSFGLCRDNSGTEFGASSEEYRIRLFNENEFTLFQSEFDGTNSEEAALFEHLINGITTVGFITAPDWLEYCCNANWWLEELKTEENPSTPEQFDNAIDQLKVLLNNGLVEEDFMLSELESYPQLATALNELHPAPMKVDKTLEAIASYIEDMGVTELEALTTWLCINKYESQKRKVQEIKLELGSFNECLDKNWPEQSSYLSKWITLAKDSLSEVHRTKELARNVISYQGESDANLDASVIMETFSLQQYETLQGCFQDQYEMEMNGDCSTASTCIILNDDTLDVITGWQRSIPVIAAMYVAATIREDADGRN